MALPQAVKRAAPPAAAATRILVVDDSPANLLAIEDVLKDPGYELVLARSGREALKQVLQMDFALILLDVRMPDMDGFETAALLRRRERTRSTPIIFMTALGTDERDMLKAYLEGAADYLLKPFDPDLLRAKVRIFADLYIKTEKVRRQAEELARSNAELEQFAYAASHDLREPLRKVAGFVHLIERKYGEKLDAEGVRYIRSVVDGVERMNALILDLLEYSRAGQKEPGAPVEAEAALAAAEADVQEALRETRGRVTHDPLPRVAVSQTQLTRVFQNLIANALKFHREAPPLVHVSARREGGYWVFSVRDNGIGIAPEYVGQLFTLFKRLHSREKYPGTGIGLAICRKVIETAGGRIWVESEVGVGSTFRFTLPVV